MLELRPNCGGNLAPRPIRPAEMLAKDPGSTQPVFQPGLHRG
jgi:hypothetical protein